MALRPTPAGFVPAVLFVALFAASEASADVEIVTTPLRDYELPGTIELDNGMVMKGAGDSTLIVNTMGETPDVASCGVVIATPDDARLLEYQYAGDPTQCIGALPHPSGGVFIRGNNPAAVEGEVTGFTSFIGPEDDELWAIEDSTLVNAGPEPNGTGEFQGAYQTAHGALSYSAELDKLIAFTIGKLTIGIDEKFISQAHVVNVESGRLTLSGQTFGLSGVGVVGGVTTRSSDGDFLIYYYSTGDRGAFFYEYNGRQDISFFKPRGEDWDDRYVIRMIYENDLLHLLWTPSDEPTTETRVTATTDSGAELWSAVLPSKYVFADGKIVELGAPLTMWVATDFVVVLHQDAAQELYLRVLDRNGEQLGVARLTEVTQFPPRAILRGPNDSLTLLSYDQDSRRVFEDTMSFVNLDDYDPNAGIPDGGYMDMGIPGDFGLPPDFGVRDALEAAGCCATAPHESDDDGALVILTTTLFAVVLRRRR